MMLSGPTDRLFGPVSAWAFRHPPLMLIDVRDVDPAIDSNLIANAFADVPDMQIPCKDGRR